MHLCSIHRSCRDCLSIPPTAVLQSRNMSFTLSIVYTKEHMKNAGTQVLQSFFSSSFFLNSRMNFIIAL